MESLTETTFFCLLSGKGTTAKVQGETTLESAYKDFAHLVVDKCTAAAAEIPAYFTLNYTRIELAQLQRDELASGSGKKCGNSKLSPKRLRCA
jgi:hypothetical protein